jgi:ankyrin repeat protein
MNPIECPKSLTNFHIAERSLFLRPKIKNLSLMQTPGLAIAPALACFMLSFARIIHGLAMALFYAMHKNENAPQYRAVYLRSALTGLSSIGGSLLVLVSLGFLGFAAAMKPKCCRSNREEQDEVAYSWLAEVLGRNDFESAKFHLAHNNKITDGMMCKFTQTTNNYNVVKFLLENGGNPNAKPLKHSDYKSPQYHFSPLHNTIVNKDKELLKLLIQHKVDLKTLCFDHPYEPRKITALEYLLKHLVWKDGEEDEKINFLEIFYKADPTLFTQFGSNKKLPLHLAESEETIEWIIKNTGVSIDSRDKNGNAAIHYAAESNHVFWLVALIKLGTNLDIRNGNGQTALHIAAEKGYPNIAGTLLGFKARDHFEDHDGRTPWDLAILPTVDPEREANRKVIQNLLLGPKRL